VGGSFHPLNKQTVSTMFSNVKIGDELFLVTESGLGKKCKVISIGRRYLKLDCGNFRKYSVNKHNGYEGPKSGFPTYRVYLSEKEYIDDSLIREAKIRKDWLNNIPREELLQLYKKYRVL